MASVTFEKVGKTYPGGTVAVRELDLEVRDGEFMVLVGPSGCGKSTALRMLAGLEEVTAGTIRIGERAVNGVPAQDRDVAMVFQSYALYPHMSVLENLTFGLRNRGMARRDAEAKATEAARTLGLDELLDRRPGQLSGGQRQRVALGRAIVREPAVFLLDEPLSNLDAALRVETRINLQKLHRRLGATFVYVTHDQVEAMTMGDRIAVMKDGVLQQLAPPREVYENPANEYVAGFIGSPRMNFIPVRVDGRTATASGFSVELPSSPGVAAGKLGIRPENLDEHPRAGGPTLDMQVDVVEELGSDLFLYGRVGEDDLVARVNPAFKAEAGGRVRLGINSRRLHLFDPTDGRALL